MSSTHEFKVAMTCKGCSGAVERVLTRHRGSGIDDFSIDLEEQKVYVTSSLSVEKVLEIIKRTGKEASYIKTH